MKKLVIIPAYNEKDSIVNTVKDIKDNAQGFDYIVVNDCSTDNTYDVCVQFDGDGQHDAAYLNEMADYLVKNECDMVIGSRFIEKEGFQSSFIRRVGIKYFTFLIHLLTGKTITDPTSGMRMCNRRTIEMFAKEYPIDYPEPESTVRLIRHKRKIEEVPVIMRERADIRYTI